MPIKRKDFGTFLALSIITCGIYMIYFVYKTTQEVNFLAGDDGKEMNPTLSVVLFIVTCGLYTYWWIYTVGNRIKDVADANNIPTQENGTTYLLWYTLGALLCGLGIGVGDYLLIKNFNLLADSYNASLSNQSIN